MAQILTGVVTSRGRKRFAESLGAIGGFNPCHATYFVYGEGGFVQQGGGRVPLEPDPAFIDVIATGTDSLNPGNSLLRFKKFLVASDFTFLAPSTVEIRCRLTPSEANTNVLGQTSKFFELGIYDAFDNLLAYTTFDEQSKTATKSLISFVQIFF